MRKMIAYAICLVLLTTTWAATAAPEGIGPAPLPVRTYIRTVPIGPTDYQGPPRKVSGKLSLIAILPSNAGVTTIHFLVDEAVVGQVAKAPFRTEFDSGTLADGEHIVKAIGKDETGRQVWTARTRVLISKTSASASTPNAAPPTPPKSTPPSPMPSESQESSPTPPPPSPAKGGTVISPQAKSGAFDTELGDTFTSTKYKFSISYPKGWQVRNATKDLRPKVPGSFWFVFGPQVESGRPRITVNVRRTKLEPGTDAEIYAKYNDFVRSWERKTIGKSPAFVTSGGKPEMGRVVHRAIIIRDGYAWMLNCIDNTGDPSSESGLLFEKMVNSLKTTL